MRRTTVGMGTVALACVTVLFAVPAPATPRAPTSDSEVVERLPVKRGDAFKAESARLRAALARDPRDARAAARLAMLSIARARAESDPRRLGQAQAALAAWWSDPEPPQPILVLRATIRQANHEFALARDDLLKATARDARDVQAWLTLATVQQVTGDLDAARSSCRRVAAFAPGLVGATCLAAVEGAAGNASPALKSLAAASSVSRGDSDSVRAWAVTLQAELAERLSMAPMAEVLFRQALAIDPRDGYARAALADFLLDQDRPREVLELVPSDTASDPLFLRRVIAARRTGAPDRDALAARLGARFAASRERGDRVHLREEARFAAQVLGDAPRALALAMDNWKTQKEPADARIALEAGVAARDPAAVREVIEWVSRSRLEGRPIAALVATLQRP